MPTHLKPGDDAPSFSAMSWDGSIVSLADYDGKNEVVLFFYVRDNTSGCTREARALRDIAGKLERRGVSIVGASTNTVESHARFAKNNELEFPLLADTDGSIADSYGVLRSTNNAERSTFLIGRDGKLLYVWPKVSITGHADEILAKVDELT
ncbi:MAG: peroxiredoxin [Candidatus Eisenbacteria bacterium]|nr:peroxiredoxin [Candidatus Eisenbacteria bacterium]